MLMNEKQKQFLQLRTLEGKSFQTISKEIDVPVETLEEWGANLIEEIVTVRTEEIDKIQEENDLRPFGQLRYMAEMYSRLREELNSRDFSGLPTDKLYHMLIDVEQRFNHLLNELSDDWEDEFDDFDNLDYWDDDDDGDDVYF